MRTLKKWTIIEHNESSVILNIDEQHIFHVLALEEDMFRILLQKNGVFAHERSWSIPGNAPDVAWEGRNRLDLAGFSCPKIDVRQEETSLQLSTSKMRVTIHSPLYLSWEYFEDGIWKPFLADRKTGAYMLGRDNERIAHFHQRNGSEMYYGLGEKAGNLKRNNRRFEMRSLDAMGYNAETTDPLYKHIPFYICKTPQISCGLFYDNLSTCWFDLGNELDNYHAWYTRYSAEAGDLDYYVFLGPSVLDVTKKYVRLTGKTAFGPKWSLGYSGSTMSYTDAPDAQEQLLGFLSLCRNHNIPCDSFQLSSGYTSIGSKRYVFNWNHEKFPDIQKFTETFHSAGLKLAANIKPCLLHDHPHYDAARQESLFILDSEQDIPEISVFWDDEGSHLDFTNPATISWWKQNVTKQLLEKGIDSTWNDNNEYVVWDDQARCHGFGKPIAIKYIRPLMSLLMMRASFEAQQAFSPDKRPYLISRSGAPGMQRYVQTWSGDNRTDWKTIRYNTRMGLGMSLSGLYNIGHDVGGFSGRKPEEELFVRWVQNGIMHPRFTIHSWNDDATTNEPWMYPRVTPMIRDAINLRYTLLPYIYTLLYKAHRDDEPMLRPTFLDHEHDLRTFEETDDFLLGQDILVASVMEEGQRQRDVYLPDNQNGWYCWYSGFWYAGGQEISLPAPLERLPLLARAGSVIPMSERLRSVTLSDEETRVFSVFPHQGQGQSTALLFEDDGESFRYQTGEALWLSLELRSHPEFVELTIMADGSFTPSWQQIRFRLPSGEQRPLHVNGRIVQPGENYDRSLIISGGNHG